MFHRTLRKRNLQHNFCQVSWGHLIYAPLSVRQCCRTLRHDSVLTTDPLIPFGFILKPLSLGLIKLAVETRFFWHLYL